MPQQAPTVLRGRLWPGGGRPAYDDGAVLVDEIGRVAYAGAASNLPTVGVPLVVGATWVGPALVDAHVHLSFGDYDEMLAGGVVAVRDLGAPLDRALRWRSETVQVAGPVFTAPGGYPSNGWGAAGFAWFVSSPDEAAAAVRAIADKGVDVVKLALEPAGGQPVPDLEVAAAVVAAAHAQGLSVTAHALTVAMVERALDAGVDEFAHTPVEPLPAELVDRIAAGSLHVVSTIETLTTYSGSAVTSNAAALVAAGVPLVYGTDLGNSGTRTGAEPRELERLAAAGLGREGALRAATRPVEAGRAAALVGLDSDPVEDPTAWRRPVVVVAGRRIIERRPPSDRR